MPKIKQIPFLFLATLMGCTSSWKKNYLPEGSTQDIIVETELASGGPLTSDTAELDIFEERPNCQMKYQGTSKLKKNASNKIPLKTGTPFTLVLNRNQSRYLGNRLSTDSNAFRITPGKNVKYKITHRERGSSAETLLLRKKARSSKYREVNSTLRSNCSDIEIIR